MNQSVEALFAQSPIPSLVIHPSEDRIVYTNQSACRLLNTTEDTLLSSPASQYLYEDLPAWRVFTDETFSNGEAWSDTLNITPTNATSIRIEVAAKSIESQTLFITLQDYASLQRQREKSDAQRHYQSGLIHWNRIAKVFREFERENQLILDAAGEGIYGVDTEGRTTFVNYAAERMLGWNKTDLIGKNIHHVIHHSHRDGSHFSAHDCSIFQAFKDGIKRNVEDEIFWTKDGKAIEVEYTSTPIKDNGYLVGAVVIFRDVTQKRSDQRKLISALQEVKTLKTRLEMENAYLQEELSLDFNHHHIVGNTPAIKQTLQKIEMVGPTSATVLIHGESGTGKELIARAIHESSDRHQRSLIRVNCAAIPSELFESEFFGHCKGAFTGATDNRVGRFELADGGTLFLDEVGEIPLSLQGKLLRVLQEQQFERVGETQTRHVDVRIIAATNRNLDRLVQEGKFREDLYFRLNVFPIESTPLRKRLGDIPILAQHFLNREEKKSHKSNLKIPLTEIEKLKHYHWPGNIRELENIIERQVILCQGDIIRFPDLDKVNVPDLRADDLASSNDLSCCIPEEQVKVREKQNLINALRATRGKVSGKNGAASLLGVKPTTLSSRIKRYGLDIRAFKETA